jgi:excisionase family DNA binding protein
MVKTLKEAAEFLDRTERAVERYVAQGKLSSRKEWRDFKDGRRRRVSIFEELELEQLKREMEAPKTRPKLVPPQPEQSEELMFVGGKTKYTLPALEFALAELFKSRGKSGEVSLTEKLLLTYDEATKVSGIPRVFLEAAVSDGRLRAVKDVDRRGIRIKRDDLNEFVRGL